MAKRHQGERILRVKSLMTNPSPLPSQVDASPPSLAMRRRIRMNQILLLDVRVLNPFAGRPSHASSPMHDHRVQFERV